VELEPVERVVPFDQADTVGPCRWADTYSRRAQNEDSPGCHDRAIHPGPMSALDARTRRRVRHRCFISTVAFGLVALTVLCAETGGSALGVAPARYTVPQRGALTRGRTAVFPVGRARLMFLIVAPAERAYDVKLVAPASSVVTIAVHLAPGTKWALSTGDRQACRRLSARTTCVWHFAAGGNPGGTWRAVVEKDTFAKATVAFAVVFLLSQRDGS
jgi:hypothetical protein